MGTLHAALHERPEVGLQHRPAWRLWQPLRARGGAAGAVVTGACGAMTSSARTAGRCRRRSEQSSGSPQVGETNNLHHNSCKAHFHACDRLASKLRSCSMLLCWKSKVVTTKCTLKLCMLHLKNLNLNPAPSLCPGALGQAVPAAVLVRVKLGQQVQLAAAPAEAPLAPVLQCHLTCLSTQQGRTTAA